MTPLNPNQQSISKPSGTSVEGQGATSYGRKILCVFYDMPSIVQILRSNLRSIGNHSLRWLGAQYWRVLISLTLWSAALFAPIYLSYPIGRVGLDDLVPDYPFAGWRLLLLGWLGPLLCAPGWYANIPFAISIIRSLSGHPVGRPMAMTGIVLAATALAPFRYLNFESGVVIWYFLRGPALWLWLGALGLMWLPAIWKGTDQTCAVGWPRWRLHVDP